jgi:hypothetical protein
MGRRAGRAETRRPVTEERPNDVRKAEIQNRQYEELVPEHVTEVALAVKSPCADADVAVDDVARSDL